MRTIRKKQRTKRRKIRINKVGGVKRFTNWLKSFKSSPPPPPPPPQTLEPPPQTLEPPPDEFKNAHGEIVDGQILYMDDNGYAINNPETASYALSHDRIPPGSINAIINIGAPDSEEVVNPTHYTGKFKNGKLSDELGTLFTYNSSHIFEHIFEGGIRNGKKNGSAIIRINHPPEEVAYYIEYTDDKITELQKAYANDTENQSKTPIETFVGGILTNIVSNRRPKYLPTKRIKPTVTMTISIRLHGRDDLTKRVKHNPNVNCRLLSVAGETSVLAIGDYSHYIEDVYNMIINSGYSIIKSGETPHPDNPKQISTFEYLEILQRVYSAYGYTRQIVTRNRLRRSAFELLKGNGENDYYLDKSGKIINPVVEHDYIINSDDLLGDTGIFTHDFESKPVNILLSILVMIYTEKKNLFLNFRMIMNISLIKHLSNFRLSLAVKKYNPINIDDDDDYLKSTPRSVYVNNRNRIVENINKLNDMLDILAHLNGINIDGHNPGNFAHSNQMTIITLSDVIRFFSQKYEGEQVVLNIIDHSCRSNYDAPTPPGMDLLHLSVAESQGVVALRAYGGKRKTRKRNPYDPKPNQLVN